MSVLEEPRPWPRFSQLWEQLGMPSRPNISLILADDLGHGDLSSVNGGLSCTLTPNALIGESVPFAHCYAASPVCHPSRARS